jgi:hypothetical protein
LIPTPKDLILAIGPSRHLSTEEIVHAICLKQNTSDLARRIFCNSRWITRRIAFLGKQNLLMPHVELDDNKQLKIFDAPRYRLTAQGESAYYKYLAASDRKRALWVWG